MQYGPVQQTLHVWQTPPFGHATPPSSTQLVRHASPPVACTHVSVEEQDGLFDPDEPHPARRTAIRSAFRMAIAVKVGPYAEAV